MYWVFRETWEFSDELHIVFVMNTDKFTLSVYCNSCFTKYNRMQSKHKQIVNIADENLTDCILSRFHYTNSKNFFKRRCQIRH